MDARDDAVNSLLGEVASAPSVTPPLTPGAVVDDVFRIERRLGKGGMGVVYLAHDVRLNRAVALKLHGAAGVAGDESALHEAKVTARLSHPHVVTVHQVGTYRGQLFIAMEYVDGGTLRRWLAERPRRWNEVLDMFVQAGRGIAAAHDAGLVHRDFKADNVLVGKDGRVRVADFGLARAVGSRAEDPGNAATVPSPGSARAGTPSYMSPEQKRGEPVNARSDQYSFCVAFDEALATTGRVPGWLSRVVARGRDDDPARRWPSVHELLQRVDRRRRRRRLALAAAVALALAAAGSFAAWRVLRDPTAPASGRWTGFWGDFLLRVEADGTARGVYSFDNGAVMGRMENGVFRGWWCETPTRKPPRDTGEMEFWFVAGEDGQDLSGRWRYGTTGEWDHNWKERWVPGRPDPSLAPRFDDPTQFCPHP